MTYQAASGAGAKHVRELIKQMQFITKDIPDLDSMNILDLINQKLINK
jgi:aspartate-semialdehyde dehydrogenase